MKQRLDLEWFRYDTTDRIGVDACQLVARERGGEDDHPAQKVRTVLLDEIEDAGEIEAIILEMARLAGKHSGQLLRLLIAGQPHLSSLFQKAAPNS